MRLRRFWLSIASTLLMVTAPVAAHAADVNINIVGGTTATISDAPWQVALVHASGSSDFTGQFCGGSLISAQWIVTAAHCVVGESASSIKVLYGTANLSTSAKQSVSISRIVSHPSYNSSTMQNDIALIQLAAAETSSTATAIALPSAKPAAGTSARITGWGNTAMENSAQSFTPSFPTQLQKAQVTVQTDSLCNSELPGEYYASTMLCAKTNYWMQDTCQGDSGGPLATLSGSTWVLSGITSWGYGCAWLSAGVYTNVANYVTWVNSNATVTSPSQSLTTTPTPTITGTAAVGQTLQVTPGTWQPAPVALSYQWNRNGSPIAGANGTSYIVSSLDAGTSITVSVTGTKSGYTTATTSSAGRTIPSVVASSFGAGTFRVGSEIAAGVYISANSSTTYCSWTRLRDFSGSFTQNGSGIGKAQQIVEIQSGDVGFASSNCGTWTLLSSKAVSKLSSIPGEGMYSFAKSLNAGIYVSSNDTSTYCSWTRLKDFTGNAGQNASGIGKGPQIVEMKSIDVGFGSSGCGTWTLLSGKAVSRFSTIPGEGTYSLSKSLTAGVYYSTNANTTYCSWTRLKDFTGGYSQNASGIGKSQQIVEIKSTDLGFSSSGCGTWRLLSSMTTRVLNPIPGEGTFPMTKQVQAGTYRSSNDAGTYCSWTRLRDFTGGYSQNATGIGQGPQVVTIRSTDVGFSSSGCGTWVRQ